MKTMVKKVLVVMAAVAMLLPLMAVCGLADSSQGVTTLYGDIQSIEATFYTVHFVDEDGTLLDVAQFMREGYAAVPPSVPNKPGKVFTGWVSEPAGVDVYNISCAEQSTIIFRASYYPSELEQPGQQDLLELPLRQIVALEDIIGSYWSNMAGQASGTTAEARVEELQDEQAEQVEQDGGWAAYDGGEAVASMAMDLLAAVQNLKFPQDYYKVTFYPNEMSQDTDYLLFLSPGVMDKDGVPAALRRFTFNSTVEVYYPNTVAMQWPVISSKFEFAYFMGSKNPGHQLGKNDPMPTDPVFFTCYKDETSSDEDWVTLNFEVENETHGMIGDPSIQPQAWVSSFSMEYPVDTLFDCWPATRGLVVNGVLYSLAYWQCTESDNGATSITRYPPDVSIEIKKNKEYTIVACFEPGLSFDVEVKSDGAVYDGNDHSVTVTIDGAAPGSEYTVEYSTNPASGIWTPEPPKVKDVGISIPVYVRVFYGGQEIFRSEEPVKISVTPRQLTLKVFDGYTLPYTGKAPALNELNVNQTSIVDMDPIRGHQLYLGPLKLADPTGGISLGAHTLTIWKSDICVMRGQDDVTGNFNITIVNGAVRIIGHIIISEAGFGGTIYPAGRVLVGESQRFDFTPRPGYVISRVLINGVYDDRARTNGFHVFTGMTADGSISVEFAPVYYIITATAGKGGSITRGGTVSVTVDDITTYVFVPDKGYRLSQVLINGISNPLAAVNGQYTFINAIGNQTIHVTFEQIPKPAEVPVKEDIIPNLMDVTRQQMDTQITELLTFGETEVPLAGGSSRNVGNCSE